MAARSGRRGAASVRSGRENVRDRHLLARARREVAKLIPELLIRPRAGAPRIVVHHDVDTGQGWHPCRPPKGTICVGQAPQIHRMSTRRLIIAIGLVDIFYGDRDAG